jgi:hypothetical protein
VVEGAEEEEEEGEGDRDGRVQGAWIRVVSSELKERDK